ncbi:MAG: HEAT repeat domain-containing protein [Candidatus Methylomirabilales bacterium]
MQPKGRMMGKDASRDTHADAGFQRELAEVLVGIKKAIKIFLAYGANHPARVQALERSHKQITELLAQQAPLSLQISREGFCCADVPVGRNHPLLQGFDLELTIRRIYALRFLSGVRLEDLQHLTELLIMEPAELSRQGGGSAFLQERGARGVEVEDLEMKFVGMASPRGAEATTHQEGPPGDPTAQPAPPTPAEQAAPQAAPMPGGEPHGTENAGEGEAGGLTGGPDEKAGTEEAGGEAGEAQAEEARPDLEALILELQQTDRPARYEYLTEELSRMGREALARGEDEPCLRIMAALARELDPSSAKAETVTRYARWTLRSLLDETGPQPLVEGFCRGGAIPEDDLVHLLLTLKAELAGPLVHQLVREREIAARHRMADLLIQMGDAARPAIRSALKAPAWERARRLFPLLQRLEATEVTEILTGLLRHSDARIRRESVRLLGQMGGELTGESLLLVLEDSEPSVREAAMATLGGLKVRAAVSPLRRIAQEPPGARELEEQKMAIAALGAIGDAEALPTLLFLLHRKRWLLRRRTEQLRIAAAYALGALGGSEATEALRAAARSAPPALRRACETALKGAHRSEETEEA